jgi:hypothetical protein
VSAPIVDLTPAERADILACERAIGTLTERVSAIRRDAALRDGIAPEWLAAHA